MVRSFGVLIWLKWIRISDPRSTSTGHNIKWDHFEIFASGQCDLQFKIKETVLIRDLKPARNENVGSENYFFINLHRMYFLLFIVF